MRSNGAVHIGNDCFVAVTRDVTSSVFLFDSFFSTEEQLVALSLSRKARFHPHASLPLRGSELQRYVKTGNEDGETAAASSGKCDMKPKTTSTSAAASTVEAMPHDGAADAPGFRCSAHASPDGHQIAFISNGRRHHYIVDLAAEPKPAVCEFQMPDLVRSVCWHPTQHHVLYVLFVPGYLMVFDTSRSHIGVVLPRHRRVALRPVLMRCLADCEKASMKGVKDLSKGVGDDTTYQSPSVYQTKLSEDGEKKSAEPARNVTTAQTDLVDMYALAPTASMPVILLLLSSSGDVYAMHLDDDTLPALATADGVDDGRLRAREEEHKRLLRMASTSLQVEVYHLMEGEKEAETPEEALAVRGCCIDADAGTHTVFYYTSSGSVKGVWVSEADLLARHRVAHAKAVAGVGSNVSFVLHLNGTQPASVRAALSPAVPTTSHTVTMIMEHNLCLLRGGVYGEVAHLIAFPCWDTTQKGWVCWCPPCAEKRDGAMELHALPLLSIEAAIPSPVSLRLPYDTRDCSVALGVRELLLFSEVSGGSSSTADNTSGASPQSLSIRLVSLLRSALYARCGPVQLHPPTLKGSQLVATTVPLPSALPAGTAAANVCGNLPALVNAVPECHRRWLRNVPQRETDAATVNLAILLDREEADLKRRESLQVQRRERLANRVAALEGRVSELRERLSEWQQTLLDAIVHRRGADAVRTANERLGEVHTRLKEWEQML